MTEGNAGGLVSFDPADSTKGGSLYDDFDGTIIAVGVGPWTPPAKAGSTRVPVTKIAVALTLLADGEGSKPFVEHKSIGSPDWIRQASEKGEALPEDVQGVGITAAPGKEMPKGINEGSNAGKFIADAASAGFTSPALKLGNLVKAFTGARFHFKKKEEQGADGKYTSLSVTKYLGQATADQLKAALSGVAPAAAGTAVPASSPAAVSSSNASDDVKEKAREIVQGVVLETTLAEQELTPAALNKAATKLLKESGLAQKDQVAALQLIMSAKGLETIGFSVKAGKVTAKEE